MNAKMGKPLWLTPSPKSISKNTMLVGIDMYHKLVGGRKCLGFVATMDSDFTTFFSKPIIAHAD